MFNFIAGIGCVIAGIYLMEAQGASSVAMSGTAGLLILFGVYRLIVMLLDMGE